MRNRHCARFLRIVNEIALGEVVRVLTDNFDRLFVRAHRSIRAQSEELRAHDVVRLDRKTRIDIETCVRHVITHADGEMILRRCLRDDRPYRPPTTRMSLRFSS